LPALEHHTYSEDDVEEGGIKIKKKTFFHENGDFLGLCCGQKIGETFFSSNFIFIPNHQAKQGIKNFSPN
jgi:glutamine amidotransferase-like uncharacterized protein